MEILTKLGGIVTHFSEIIKLTSEIFVIVFQLTFRTISFGAGGGEYKNSFENITYSVFKYNNNIDKRYLNQNSNSPFAFTPEWHLSFCTCYEKFFINYYLYQGWMENNNFQSSSYSGEFFSYRYKDLSGFSEGTQSRGHGGIRAGFRIFEIGKIRPAIVIGNTIYAARYNYFPLLIQDTQFNILSSGDFISSTRGNSIGGQIEFVNNPQQTYILQLHYLELKGTANIFNTGIFPSNNFFVENQEGKMSLKGIEAGFGLKNNHSKVNSTYIGLVFSYMKTSFQMDQNWKIEANRNISSLNLERFFNAQILKPKFTTEDIYLGFRLTYELNWAALEEESKSLRKKKE